MGNYENLFYEIYSEITAKNLSKKFDKTIQEMLLDKETMHLSMRDKWSSAFERITNEN